MAFVRGLQAAVATMLLGMGFGQAALGRPRRGFAWLAGVVIAYALSAVSIWFVPIAMLGVLASMIDAFVIGYRTTADPPFRWVRVSTISILIAAVACLLLLRGFVVEAFKSPSSSMYPTLQIGDHTLISKLASAELGDIAVFRFPCDPDRDYIKRVVARGGDTVEVRCNVLYVNGKPIANQLIQDGTQCSYSDYDAYDQRWFQRQCSRYRETLGSHSYDVFHDAERPGRDASPERKGDARDFPARTIPFPPSCQMSEEQPSNHPEVRGTIVETTPEGAGDACAPQLHYVVPPDHVFVLGDNRNNSNDSRVWGGVPVKYIKGPVVGIWLTSRPGEGWSFSRFGPAD